MMMMTTPTALSLCSLLLLFSASSAATASFPLTFPDYDSFQSSLEIFKETNKDDSNDYCAVGRGINYRGNFNKCELIRFFCSEANTVIFHNDCGCGCRTTTNCDGDQDATNANCQMSKLPDNDDVDDSNSFFDVFDKGGKEQQHPKVRMIVTIGDTTVIKQQEVVPFETIMKGTYSGIEDELEAVYRTNDDYLQFFMQHHSNVMPMPMPPTVNFRDDNLLIAAIYLGTFNSGGFNVEMKNVVILEEGIVVVEYVTSEPGPSDMVTMALTQPYHVIQIGPLPGTIDQENVQVRFFDINKQQEVVPLRFLITFTENVTDPNTVTQKIQNSILSEYITNIQLLGATGIGIIDFGDANIDAKMAMQLLKRVDGVATVELDSVVGIINNNPVDMDMTKTTTITEEEYGGEVETKEEYGKDGKTKEKYDGKVETKEDNEGEIVKVTKEGYKKDEAVTEKDIATTASKEDIIVDRIDENELPAAANIIDEKQADSTTVIDNDIKKTAPLSFDNYDNFFALHSGNWDYCPIGRGINYTNLSYSSCSVSRLVCDKESGYLPLINNCGCGCRTTNCDNDANANTEDCQMSKIPINNDDDSREAKQRKRVTVLIGVNGRLDDEKKEEATQTTEEKEEDDPLEDITQQQEYSTGFRCARTTLQESLAKQPYAMHVIIQATIETSTMTTKCDDSDTTAKKIEPTTMLRSSETATTTTTTTNREQPSYVVKVVDVYNAPSPPPPTIAKEQQQRPSFFNFRRIFSQKEEEDAITTAAYQPSKDDLITLFYQTDTGFSNRSPFTDRMGYIIFPQPITNLGGAGCTMEIVTTPTPSTTPRTMYVDECSNLIGYSTIMHASDKKLLEEASQNYNSNEIAKKEELVVDVGNEQNCGIRCMLPFQWFGF